MDKEILNRAVKAFEDIAKALDKMAEQMKRTNDLDEEFDGDIAIADEEEDTLPLTKSPAKFTAGTLVKHKELGTELYVEDYFIVNDDVVYNLYGVHGRSYVFPEEVLEKIL